MNVNLVQMGAKVQGTLHQLAIGSARTKMMKKLSAKMRERRIKKKTEENGKS